MELFQSKWKITYNLFSLRVYVHVHIWTPFALLGVEDCTMCYAKSNFLWMCNKASDLTYNLSVISYELSRLEAHKQQQKAC